MASNKAIWIIVILIIVGYYAYANGYFDNINFDSVISNVEYVDARYSCGSIMGGAGMFGITDIESVFEIGCQELCGEKNMTYMGDYDCSTQKLRCKCRK